MRITRPKSDFLYAIYSYGILIIVILLIYILLIEPAAIKRGNNKQRIETIEFQIKKLGNKDHVIKQLKKEIDDLKTSDIDKNGFFNNKTPSIATAELQKIFKHIIESNGASLVSTQVLQAEEKNIYPKIAIKTYIRCNVKALRKIFYELMSYNPLLFVDNVIIQTRNTNRNSSQTENKSLDVRFELSAYINTNKSL